MLKRFSLYAFGLAFLLAFSPLSNATELPTQKEIQTQLTAAKASKADDVAQQELVADLQDTLNLLQDIDKQKATNEQLKAQIAKAGKDLAVSRANVDKLKNAQTGGQKSPSFDNLSLADLQGQLVDVQTQLQQLQTTLTPLNANLSSQKSAPERAQAALSANLERSQAINQQLMAPNLTPSSKTKLETELALLNLKDSYNQLLLNGNDDLTALYTSQVEENNLQQQQLQAEQTALQNAINAQNLAESQKQVEQATQSQQQNVDENTNPVIVSELELNTKLTESLLKHTTQLNTLSNDNLRIKTVLDNLQQTQQNINEQISSLQGTLILSRIINKQKQALPQDKMIRGLSKQITDLRVRIFDMTEMRDDISDTNSYIANLEKSNKTSFTDKEKQQLTTILQERQKVVTDLIKQLNNQLTLSINIELNQQQVQTISDSLQAKLQQQSFWVRSNNVIDLEWLQSFPQAAMSQLKDLSARVDFSNFKENAPWAAVVIAFLLGMMVLINRQKEHIKQKLTEINGQLKSVKTDSYWHTPVAIILTVILCLPSTLIFMSVLVLISCCLEDSTSVWLWAARMSGYWLYFAMMLALLRPNGIASRHFKFPPKSAENFRRTLKHSAWLIALLLNTDVLSNLDMGVSYDVIGEVMTITVLVLMCFVIAPEFRKAIAFHQNNSNGERGSFYLLHLARLILLIAPVILIALIIIGYYYTSLVLIDHLVSSYFAFTTWVILRNFVDRELEVYARRLAFRRLQEKRNKAMEKAHSTAEFAEEISCTPQDEMLAVSELKIQMQRIADFLLWIGLFTLFYFVWSDLITVAYYLDGVTLWQQTVSTDKGTVLESVTLLNLLIAFVILMVSYILVRNIGALLEVLIFSRVKLSQGTPYTLTTLSSYIIIITGAASAFSTLGMSWAKLQWLFAALSVGLGFGMQEIVGNFVSGIIILFERPVRIGDMVTIGSYTGTVSKIRIRATTLLDNDKKEVIVPNKALITDRLVNWALTDSITRVVIQIGVAYGSDIDLVKKLLLQAAAECERVLKDPSPVVYFLNFGASTLDHELRVYVAALGDRNPAIDFLNRRINELFNQNNIEIAFNQLDVYIKNQATSEEVKIGETISLKNNSEKA